MTRWKRESGVAHGPTHSTSARAALDAHLRHVLGEELERARARLSQAVFVLEQGKKPESLFFHTRAFAEACAYPRDLAARIAGLQGGSAGTSVRDELRAARKALDELDLLVRDAADAVVRDGFSPERMLDVARRFHDSAADVRDAAARLVGVGEDSARRGG